MKTLLFALGLTLLANLALAANVPGRDAQVPPGMDAQVPQVQDAQERPRAQDAQERPRVKLDTDLGPITVEVFEDKAPITAANFLRYVDEGFYNGTIFHRVIPGFVVQGGGYTFDFVSKPSHEPIANESSNGLKNRYGTLSMARTANPDSATSQFFINIGLSGNGHLDASKDKPGYAVFAKVVAGIDVVDAIAREPRGNFRAFPEAPNMAVRILKATRL